MTKPRVLIEDWLPVAAIGAESMRERGASSALPPLYFLHVWFARRPLTASRAAILASLLPAYSDDWPPELKKLFPSEKEYRNWFLRLIGIHGDPVAAKKMIQSARQLGIKLKGNPYGYPRAFTINPEPSDIKILRQILAYVWDDNTPLVLDPTAGGGSIPFESLRYGFQTYANELNPVASVILNATLELPLKLGGDFIHTLLEWGARLDERASEKLKPFFPMQPDERVRRYIWARTVKCPATGKPVPLSPNWWLQKNGEPIVVKLLTKPDWTECCFEILRGKVALESNPDKGTISKGVAISPWTGETVSGDYIKEEAQAGRMGQQLYALSVQIGQVYTFRTPIMADLDAIKEAQKELEKRLPDWEAKGLVPREPYPEISNDPRPLYYGMGTWADFFSPRQLLAAVTYVETLQDVMKEVKKTISVEKANAVQTYLAFAIDKACDRNARLSFWDTGRQVVQHVFERHDFSFKWAYAEMTIPNDGFDWAVSQIANSYKGIYDLANPPQKTLSSKGNKQNQSCNITRGDATNLPHLTDSSIHLICIDPPYYDNVMYAECSDFFYVWLKRTVGDIYPEFFTDELTDKDNEAVANVARFAAMGKGKKKELATRDYELKMAAIFKECYRVLRPDGVMTVMFNHKKVEAWDTLATALIDSGFSIKSSWPVHTESEHSLHQAKKNAAASTILLACRKREKSSEPVWWDDISNRVRVVAREKAAEFLEAGITGVDLYISTFGPTLSVISENWPVLTSDTDPKTGKPVPLRPEKALEIAREEVISLRKKGLLLGRTIQFDPITDWVLLAWDAFKAEQFPADEGRKLALALGLDVEADLVRQKKVVSKKSNFLILQQPKLRRAKGLVDPDAKSFSTLLDAIHTTMLVYQEDGAKACEAFLKGAQLLNDPAFKSAIQAFVNAIPFTKEKGKFTRPEADILQKLCLAFFEDIELPKEEEAPVVARDVSFVPQMVATDETEYDSDESEDEEDD
jgi:putative DNA methylase